MDTEGRDSRRHAAVCQRAAADVFEQWQADNSAVDDDAGSLFKSFVGKMDGVVLRLALVAEMSAWAFGGGARAERGLGRLADRRGRVGG